MVNTCTAYEFLDVPMFTCTKWWLAWDLYGSGCLATVVVLLQVARHPVMGLSGVTEEFGEVS